MPSLLKSKPTPYGIDATVWVVGAAQWDAFAEVFDVTLFGYASAEHVGIKQPIAVEQTRLQGDSYPIGDLVLADSTTDRGILYSTIFQKLMADPNWTDATFVA